MVKFIEKIQNSNLPTVANNIAPNPAWNSNNSFDYKQYYEKKKAYRAFEQAKSLDENELTRTKVDESFKLDFSNDGPYVGNITGEVPGCGWTNSAPAFNATPKSFFYYSDYQTRSNITKFHHLIHPYCELTNNDSAPVAVTGNDIYNFTTDPATGEGIAGRNNSENPFYNNTGGQLTPRVFNRVKGGGLRFDTCINFKYGFKPNSTYYINP